MSENAENAMFLANPTKDSLITAGNMVLPLKRCSKCGETKPETSFYRLKNDRLENWCKSCKTQHARAWELAHPEKRRATRRQYTIQHREQGNARNRQWYANHREQVKAHSCQWQANHREHVKARKRQYRANHREELKEKARAYRLANPEQNRATVARHNALKAGANGAGYTTHNHIRARWEMFGGRCWLCDKKATATDHVKPLSRGGSHLPCNLRPICPKCNSKKQAKWPFDTPCHHRRPLPLP